MYASSPPQTPLVRVNPLPNVVHVPRMSGHRGFNDKFAWGLRAPMHAYLTRINLVGRRIMQHEDSAWAS